MTTHLLDKAKVDDAAIIRVRNDLQAMDSGGWPRELTPPNGAMQVELLRHQRVALAWMRMRETSGLPHGGILADDQGLGKTISTLALIVTERSRHRDSTAIDTMHATLEAEDKARAADAKAGGGAKKESQCREVGGSVGDSEGGGSQAARPSATATNGEVIELLDSDDESEGCAESTQSGDVGEAGELGAAGGGSAGAHEQSAVGADAGEQPSSGGADASTAHKQPAIEFVVLDDESDDDCVMLEQSDSDEAEVDDSSDMDCVILGSEAGVNASADEGGRPPGGGSGGGKRTDQAKRPARISMATAAAATFPGGSRIKGGTLIVCPTCVLHQWAREIAEKVSPAADIRVLVYHGEGRNATAEELAAADVVLTTYGTLTMDCNRGRIDPEEVAAAAKAAAKTRRKGKAKAQEAEVDKADQDKGWAPAASGPLYSISWHRVVLDEAQSVKNARTAGAHAVTRLKARRRWCLSGTPMQNSVTDLLSYFRFLRYDPFNSAASFALHISEPIKANEDTGYRRLQQILKLVMLRRTKGSTLGGKPIVNLPKRTVGIKTIMVKPRHMMFYRSLERRCKQEFNSMDSSGKLRGSIINALTMLLRLRQAASHPKLVKGWEELADAVNRALDAYDPDEGGPKPLDAADVVELAAEIFGLGDKQIHAKKGGDDEVADELGEGEGEELDTKAGAGGDADLGSCEDLDNPSKVAELLKSLEELRAESRRTGAHEKTVIFSQWTALLDLLEPRLRAQGFSFRRVDGRMTVPKREAALADFRDPANKVDCMLMSLKAASLGINLTCARNVLLLDQWWNPTTEDQAIDRCHRIGQDRDVRVTRFVMFGTVEERIMKLQQRKRQLVASSFGENQADGSNVTTSAKSRLGLDELRYLLG